MKGFQSCSEPFENQRNIHRRLSIIPSMAALPFGLQVHGSPTALLLVNRGPSPILERLESHHIEVAIVSVENPIELIAIFVWIRWVLYLGTVMGQCRNTILSIGLKLREVNEYRTL